MDDLYQIGAIGFIKSIKRFDTSFDVRLSTYAVPYILGEVKRFIRDDGSIKISRSIKELSSKIKDLQTKYIKETGNEITVEQLAKELKVDKEDITLALDASMPVASIYEETNTNDENGICILDKIKTDIDEAEIIVNKLSIKSMIESLEEREKQIILLRYYKNSTQSQVAKILGISQVQVSRIEKKILESMKNKLEVCS